MHFLQLRESPSSRYAACVWVRSETFTASSYPATSWFPSPVDELEYKGLWVNLCWTGSSQWRPHANTYTPLIRKTPHVSRGDIPWMLCRLYRYLPTVLPLLWMMPHQLPMISLSYRVTRLIPPGQKWYFRPTWLSHKRWAEFLQPLHCPARCRWKHQIGLHELYRRNLLNCVLYVHGAEYCCRCDRSKCRERLRSASSWPAAASD